MILILISEVKKTGNLTARFVGLYFSVLAQLSEPTVVLGSDRVTLPPTAGIF